MIKLLKRLGILNFILTLRSLLSSKMLKESRSLYKLTDEKFKFSHILEAVNYVRVALIPPVFFEFGCHSGRTFSTAINAANFLKLDLIAIALIPFKGCQIQKLMMMDILRRGHFLHLRMNSKKL